mgnify:CR=1 FL=1
MVMLQSTKETIRDGRGLAWRSKHQKIKRTCGITKWIQIIFASWRWRLWMKMCYQWYFRMLPHTRKNPCETDLPINLSYVCAGNARSFACFRLHCSLRTHTHTLKFFPEQQPDIKKKRVLGKTTRKPDAILLWEVQSYKLSLKFAHILLSYWLNHKT